MSVGNSDPSCGWSWLITEEGLHLSLSARILLMPCRYIQQNKRCKFLLSTCQRELSCLDGQSRRLFSKIIIRLDWKRPFPDYTHFSMTTCNNWYWLYTRGISRKERKRISIIFMKTCHGSDSGMPMCECCPQKKCIEFNKRTVNRYRAVEMGCSAWQRFLWWHLLHMAESCPCVRLGEGNTQSGPPTHLP